MDDRNSGTNQGGQDQSRTSRPGTQPPGKDVERELGNYESDKPSTRPTPSGVPNEGRSAEGQSLKCDQTQSDAYKYEGERQGQGSVPYLDEAGDHESAESFRTAAEIETDAQLDLASNAEPDDETVGDADGADVDLDDEEDESNEASEVTGQSHNDELNRQPRNPE